MITPLKLDLAVAFGLALDHGDRGEIREDDLIRVAPLGRQPRDLVAHGVAGDLDPAVVAVDGLVPAEQAWRWIGEEGHDLLPERRAVGLTNPPQSYLTTRGAGAMAP